MASLKFVRSVIDLLTHGLYAFVNQILGLGSLQGELRSGAQVVEPAYSIGLLFIQLISYAYKVAR